MTREDFDLVGDALPFPDDGEACQIDCTEDRLADHDGDFDLARFYLDAIGADDPPEMRTAASTAIENGGPIFKKSDNTEVADGVANRNQKEVPEPTCSALSRVLPFTVFPSISGRSKQEHRNTLREVAERIRNTQAEDKKQLPYGKLATFGSHRSKGGSLRNNANMSSIHGIEADYDAGKMSVEDASRKLREAGLAALIWTTPSHSADSPRFRILSPTCRELPVSERKALVARLNGVLGGVLDGASFVASQAMSFGHVTGRDFSVELIEGRFIDEASDLDSDAIGKAQRKGEAKLRASVAPIPDFTLDDARKILEAIPEEWWNDYHNWFKALLAMHYQFRGSQAAFELLEKYCRSSPKYDAEDQREKWANITHETDNPVTMASLIAVANEARRDEERQGLAAEFDDDAVEEGTERNVYHALQLTKNGDPLGNLANVMTILERDRALAGIVALDLMRGAPILLRAIPGTSEASFTPRPLKDSDTAALEEYLQRQGLRSVSESVVHRGLSLAAERNAFHPVRDYLGSQAWDGAPRLDDWLSTYLGVEASPYVQRVGRMFLIQMVARVMRPGSKGDYMVILEGPQGEGKSTACRILAGEQYFSDSLPDLQNNKDTMQHLRGMWLIEIGEMAAMSRSDADQIKHFVSKTSDRFRPSYGRFEVTNPRQCVFVGTTNRDAYLRDETGARRFWPVTVGTIDLDALKRDRDQLFAEAVVAFKAGEAWWPSRDFEREHIAAQQDMRHESDPWEPVIANYVEDQDRVTTLEIARLALQIPTERLGTLQQRRIGACMKRLGWSELKSNGNRYFVRGKKRRAS